MADILEKTRKDFHALQLNTKDHPPKEEQGKKAVEETESCTKDEANISSQGAGVVGSICLWA